MTKERLEELIKQGGTVYKISYGKVWEMPLINDEKNHCDISRDKFLHFHELLEFNDSLDNRWTDFYVGLDELFETKDRAEWCAKIYRERPERFEPPMWEDIEDYYEFNFVNGIEDYSLRVKKNNFIEICLGADDVDDIFLVYNKYVTKENPAVLRNSNCDWNKGH